MTQGWARQGQVLLGIVALAGALLATWPGGAQAARAAASAATGTDASVTAVSCAPGGVCVAGGSYETAATDEAFVTIGENGTWGSAIEVPGLAALDTTGATVTAVSCTAGGCVVGGEWYGTRHLGNAFVVSERDGQWSGLTTVKKAAQNKPIGQGGATITSLSCAGSENCTAGGQPAFAVTETEGHWAATHAFAANPGSEVSVSCPSAGNCRAGWGANVDREESGSWLASTVLRGLSRKSVNAYGNGISSIACTGSVASCEIGGVFPFSHGGAAFTASERSGLWSPASALPGWAALDSVSGGDLAAVSCLSAGNCVAVGDYAAYADFAGGSYAPFVASERNGTWGDAIDVPGIPKPGNPPCEPDSSKCVEGQVLTASCAPGGTTCAAGGWYGTPHIPDGTAFVTLYQDGSWTDVTQIPGLDALGGSKNSGVNSVSCTSAGTCTAGGGTSGEEEPAFPAFVTREQGGTWGQAQAISFGG